MSVRPLVRRAPWELDRWRDALRRRVVAARTDAAGRAILVTPEPLFRDDGSGGLLQSIRITPEPALELGTASRVVASDLAGRSLRTTVEPGPRGSFRALVPAVDRPTLIRLELPDFAGSTPIELELVPVRHWTIHLIHHSHLDIGYTDPQPTVLSEQASMLDSEQENLVAARARCGPPAPRDRGDGRPARDLLGDAIDDVTLHGDVATIDIPPRATAALLLTIAGSQR